MPALAQATKMGHIFLLDPQTGEPLYPVEERPVPQTDIPGEPIYPKWLFYYYCTHLRHVADPRFCVDISGYLERKMQSITAYHSQFVAPEKNRRIVEWVEQVAGYMGSRIGTQAAEPFFTREPIGLTTLDSLVM